MTEELKPCPWCRAGLTQIVEGTKVWLGMRHGDPVSVSVRHWCPPAAGQPSRMIERIGKDHASAIAAWNNRPESADLALLSLIADIRKAAGDPTGKLMQSELVEHIAALRADAERYRHIRLASSRDHAHHSRSCFSVGTCWWADSPAGVMPLRGPWSVQELTGAALDAAIDNARDAK